MSEADIKTKFRKILKKHTGGAFENIRLDCEGWPDWMVLGPEGKIGFIEFKDGTRKTTPLQDIRLQWLAKNNFPAVVIRKADSETVEEFLRML